MFAPEFKQLYLDWAIDLETRRWMSRVARWHSWNVCIFTFFPPPKSSTNPYSSKSRKICTCPHIFSQFLITDFFILLLAQLLWIVSFFHCFFIFSNQKIPKIPKTCTKLAKYTSNFRQKSLSFFVYDWKTS